MRKLQEIKRLRAIAAVVLDTKLAHLRAHATARDETLARLADLATAEVIMSEHGDVADVMAAVAYQGWADARRAEMNQILARQTATWLDARDMARVAFGKADVLQSLSMRMKTAQKH